MRSLCVLWLLARVAAAQPIALPPPALVWAPLPWSMTTEQARTALDRAAMSPKDDETRRYFVQTPDHPEVRHTTEPGWAFSPRKSWHGSVHFSWSDAKRAFSMDRIVLHSDALTAGALKDELAALTSTYGGPSTTRANQYTWSRDGNTLVAGWNLDATTGRSVLYVTYAHGG